MSIDPVAQTLKKNLSFLILITYFCLLTIIFIFIIIIVVIIISPCGRCMCMWIQYEYVCAYICLCA